MSLTLFIPLFKAKMLSYVIVLSVIFGAQLPMAFAKSTRESTHGDEISSPIVKENVKWERATPLVIGHRGASGMYPEHTKLSYK